MYLLMKHPIPIALECEGGGRHPAASVGPELDVTSAGRSGRNAVVRRVSEIPGAFRLRSEDLGAAQTMTRRLKAHESQAGRDLSELVVLLEIEVLISSDSAAARAELRELDAQMPAPSSPNTVRYVGTPRGLASLIADIHTVGVADGVILVPLVTDRTCALIEHVVTPLLKEIHAAA